MIENHGPTEGDNLERILSERKDSSEILQQWSEPTAFFMQDEGQRSQLESFLSNNPNIKVVDQLGAMQSDLGRLDARDHEQAGVAADDPSRYGRDYGAFFYFPWQDALVRYPSEQDHYRLMTARNKNLIRGEEQNKLGEASVAVFGLSVGRAILSSLIRGGVGREVLIADPDYIDPTNLNRLSASFRHVGAAKVNAAAQEVSEVNPYVAQRHLYEGVQERDLQSMKTDDVDIMIDAVDDLSIKAHIRNTAQRLGLPVLMATDVGGRVLIDIERYDLGNIKPFLGRISANEYDKLLTEDELDPDVKKKMLVKIVGLRNASARILESLILFGRNELDGIPQLNSTVQAAGALATDATVEVLLGRHTNSSRYRFDKSKTIGARRNPDGVGHLLGTYAELLKS